MPLVKYCLLVYHPKRIDKNEKFVSSELRTRPLLWKYTKRPTLQEESPKPPYILCNTAESQQDTFEGVT